MGLFNPLSNAQTEKIVSERLIIYQYRFFFSKKTFFINREKWSGRINESFSNREQRFYRQLSC